MFNRLVQFAKSFTGGLVVGLSAIHALLLPALFTGAMYLIKEGHETQFVNQTRIGSHLFGALLAQAFNEQRLRSLLTDAVMGDQIIFAHIVTQRGAVMEPSAGMHIAPHRFQEDFFFGQHDDTIYYTVMMPNC